MSEDQIPTAGTDGTFKISVTFGRKISDGNYGGIEARAWAEADLTDPNPSAIAGKQADLFAACKAVVLEELGIPFTMDDNGVVREKTVPVATVTGTTSTTTVGGQDAVQRVDSAFGGNNHQLRVMNPNDLNGMEIPDWLIEKTYKDGVDAVWYNGHKATGKQPHWRQALSKAQRDMGIEPIAYWPPR